MMWDKPLNCIATFKNHQSWIHEIVITPDNKKLLSISGSEIWVWDLNKRKLIDTFEGHSAVIFKLILSPNGKILASVCFDKKIKLWDVDSGELLYTISVKKEPVASIAFSSDGTILASAGGTQKYSSKLRKTTTKIREIYLWDTDTGEFIRSLGFHSQRINKVVFGIDGNTIFSSSDDKTIKEWNIHTGELLRSIETSSSSIIINYDGTKLISYGDRDIKIWDLDTLTLFDTISHEPNSIFSCAISPNGQLIAGATYESSNSRYVINIYDLFSRKFLQSVEFDAPFSIAFSPDSSLIASGNVRYLQEQGAFVKIWQLPNCKTNEEFDLLQKDDAKTRINRVIVQRQGQGEFRKQLLKAYECKCCITGYNAEIALEAAHIIPYNGRETNHVSNGLLLRADIHTLFDLHEISIHPDTGRIVIASNLNNTCYAVELLGKYLRKPNEQFANPNKEALNQHYKEFSQKNDHGVET